MKNQNVMSVFWDEIDRFGYSEENKKTQQAVSNAIDLGGSKGHDRYTNARENEKYIKKNITPISYIYNNNDAGLITVIGAGPTGKDIDKIKKLHQRGKIVCMDRAHKHLKQNGITPDWTITADINPIVSEYLSEVDERDKVAMAVTQDISIFESVKQRGASVWGYMGINPWSWISREIRDIYGETYSGLISGRVVGTFAVQLAMLLGANYLATIGCECGWLQAEQIEDMYMDIAMPKTNLQGVLVWTIPAFWFGAGSMQLAMQVLNKRLNRLVSYHDYSGGLLSGIKVV